MADTGITIVGAGVVGLACAARLAPDHPGLVVLERGSRYGLETSSRNSEVIHAGIYSPSGSWKARLCVEGNRRLYEFCAGHDVPHRRTGKIITAASRDQLAKLEELAGSAAANGVDLRWLSARETLRLEPRIRSEGALLSESTGIVSAHGLMDALHQQARAAGAIVQLRSELVAVERTSEGYQLTLRAGERLESFTSERVINAAGLDADTVASLAGIDVKAAGYRLHYCKGSYFSVAPSKAGLISRLVYPVPGTESLGLHAVLGLDGRLRFGPDVEYLDHRRHDYQVEESKRRQFGDAVSLLFPSIREEDLSPDMAGIRPKLQARVGPFRDFVVAEESGRRLPGFVNLLGIDSPGLTSALAMAEHVADLIEG
jgi:L-2-hydroxyglutarate oxidase LhgO